MRRSTLLLLLWSFLALMPSLSAQRVRVACIGNSVTYGYGLEDPAVQSYPTILGRLLGEGYEVRNFGHSGSTLLRDGHNPYVKTKEYAAALDFKPDVAVIHLGLNDTDPRNFPHYRDRFVADYCALIDTLRSVNPAMDIRICSMTPIFPCHSRYISSTHDWYRILQGLIPRVAEARQTGFIDLYEAFRHRPDLITDPPTLHPNARGARHLAETVFRSLTGNYGGLSLDGAWQPHMVLRRGATHTITGHADRGDRITLRWRGERYLSVPVGNDGKWSITFPAGEATGEPQVLSVEGKEKKITLPDLLVGEVWLVSGQSNMAFSLKDATGGSDYAATRHPRQGTLRLLRLRPFAETDSRPWNEEALLRANELDFYYGEWKAVSTETALDFSAVGYAFASQMASKLDVPVGVIEIDNGGTPLTSWVSRDLLEDDPRFAKVFDHWRVNDYTMRWCRERMETNLQLTKDPFQRHSYDPSFNEETGYRLIYGQSLSGVLWYQGESDAENAEQYGLLFPHFVRDLRRHFGADLPVLTVQLSNLDRPSWGRFRDLQRRMAEEMKGVSLVTSYDLGERGDVHYHDKTPLGERAARLALQTVYGLRTGAEATAARPLRIEACADGWRLSLDAGEGTLETSDGTEVRGLLGETLDGQWIPLRGEIDGANLRIKRPEGSLRIVSIAYAFTGWTDANLHTAGGQPVPTFILPIPER